MDDLLDDMDEGLRKELFGKQDELLERSKLDWKRLINDYKMVFSKPAGQNVLRHIFEICRINSSTFRGNSTTFYLEGVQDVGKAIKRMIMEADPEIYFEIERAVWESEKGQD